METIMELICTGCFTHPLGAHRNAGYDAAEMLVCNLGAVALPQRVSGHDDLRCDYCGSMVHLDHRHMTWYGR
jgi:hypothetical protein